MSFYNFLKACSHWVVKVRLRHVIKHRLNFCSSHHSLQVPELWACATMLTASLFLKCKNKTEDSNKAKILIDIPMKNVLLTLHQNIIK